MAGPQLRSNHLLAALIAVLLVLSSLQGVVADDRVRYQPPTATPTDLAGSESLESSGDGGASMVVAAPVEPTAAQTNVVQAAIAEPVYEGVLSGPAVSEGAVPQENVRPRPDSRPFEAIEAAPTQAAGETDATPELPKVPRLDDPVLRWLPEIITSSEQSGTPAHIIAGVMRLESGGNPNIISPVGARGLMQIMPSNLIAMGVPQDLWHDPATNIWAGGQFLASRAAIYGSWEQAVGAYFGFGCDVFGTCTEVYISVAMGWASFYSGAVYDPYNSGYPVLPLDWVPPAINPFVEAAPIPVETPPPSTPTPTGSPSATPAASPTGTPGGSPTAEPTSVPTDVPTIEPTPIPTDVPTVEPTPVPTEVPTEIPTEVPTEAPVDPPPAEGTPAA